MVNTPNNGREATHTGVESNITTQNRSGTLKILAATVLASSLAALTPTKADAQGYSPDANIADEGAVKVLGATITGSGKPAEVEFNDDHRKATITGGAADSKVMVDAACPPGKDYKLAVDETRLEYREFVPAGESATSPVKHLEFTMHSTGQNYATLVCDNEDGDNKEIQLVFVSDSKAGATIVPLLRHSDMEWPTGFHMSLTPLLQTELVDTPKQGFATGYGATVRGSYKTGEYIDIGGRVTGLWAPEDTDGIYHDDEFNGDGVLIHKKGEFTGDNVLTHTPLLTAGPELGIGGDTVRLGLGFGLSHGFGHDTNGNTKVRSTTTGVGTASLSLFFGEPGKINAEALLYGQTNLVDDRETLLCIGLGITR